MNYGEVDAFVSRMNLDGNVEEIATKISKYMELLEFWSKKINLISKGDKSVFVEKHLEPIGTLYNMVKAVPHRRIIDLGSGAGLPGVPLKILLSNTDIVLVESRRKRANFLREVKRKLRLEGTEVINSRIEDWQGPQADIVISRAVASMGTLSALGNPHLKPHGVLMKTINLEKEPGAILFAQYGEPSVVAFRSA